MIIKNETAKYEIHISGKANEGLWNIYDLVAEQLLNSGRNSAVFSVKKILDTVGDTYKDDKSLDNIFSDLLSFKIVFHRQEDSGYRSMVSGCGFSDAEGIVTIDVPDRFLLLYEHCKAVIQSFEEI
jgi:hypothetical protein